MSQQVGVKPVALADGHGSRLPAHCMIATEVGAPSSVTPVAWRLFANRGVEGFEGAVELIDWYRARWEIEMFSRTAARLKRCNWPVSRNWSVR